MEQPIYGILNGDDCLIDTSLTLQGAKVYATKNGYNKVGKRIGYNVVRIWEKVNNKWEQTETK